MSTFWIAVLIIGGGVLALAALLAYLIWQLEESEREIGSTSLEDYYRMGYDPDRQPYDSRRG